MKIPVTAGLITCIAVSLSVVAAARAATPARPAPPPEEIQRVSDQLAAQRRAIDALTAHVAELDRRVTALGRVLDALTARSAYAPPHPQAWRVLKQGMSRQQVLDGLGMPYRFTFDLYETWYYDPSGMSCAWVQFGDNGTATSWCEPPR